MDGLELRLLGAVELRWQGRPLSLKTRKTVALLAYMALEPGPHPREKLAALLWPEADAAQGRTSLRSALANVRQALGPAADHVLLSQREHLELIAHTDVARLEASVAPGGSLENLGRLYRGPLLSGLEFSQAEDWQEWLEAWRTKVALWMQMGLARLSQERLARREWQGAAEAAQQRLALEPLSEEAVRALMQVWLAAGEALRAKNAYLEFAQRLERELGLEPEPPTLALLSQAQRALEKPSVRRRPPLAALLLEGRMAGRVREHLRLVEAYHAAAGGWPQAVVLQGESGIGKTRLANEFCNWVLGQGGVVLKGRAYEGSGGLAYLAVADALRKQLFQDPQGFAKLGPLWLSELLRLLPELRERFADLPSPLGLESEAQARLFEAVAQWGLRALPSPVVFLLDDLQWADRGTLDLLAYLARRWGQEGLGLLLLFTVRSENLGSTGEMRRFLANLSRELNLAELMLEHLSLNETRELLGNLGLEADLAQWLHQETGGQPLFVIETLKSLVECGHLRAENSQWVVALQGWSGVAKGVRATIQGRLARLSQSALEVLSAASVLGEGLTLKDLQALTELPADDVVRALDELSASRLLIEETHGYAWSHDRIKEVVYETAGLARRQQLHRRALHILAHRAPPYVLALHAMAIGQWVLAFEQFVLAGGAASQLFAWQNALQLYEQARGLLKEYPEVLQQLDKTKVAALYRRITELYANLGMRERFFELAQEVLALAERQGDPWMRIRAMEFMASQQADDNPGYSKQLLLEAREIAIAQQDIEGLIGLDLGLARLSAWLGENLQEAYQQARRVLPAAQALGGSVLEQTLVAVAAMAQRTGEWPEAIELWQQTLQVSQPRADGHYIYAWENLGLAALNQGQLKLATEALQRAYQLKQELRQNPTWVALAGSFLSLAYIETGQVALGLQLAEQSLQLSEGAIDQHNCEYLVAWGLALWAQGDIQEAARVFAQGLAIVERAPSTWLVGWGYTYQQVFHSYLSAVATNPLPHAQKAVEMRLQHRHFRHFHSARLPYAAEVRALVLGGEEQLAQRAIEALGKHTRRDERQELAFLQAKAALGTPSEAQALSPRIQQLAEVLGVHLLN